MANEAPPAKEFGGALLAPTARETTFAATRHVPWALNTRQMRLRPGQITNAFYVFTAHGTYRWLHNRPSSVKRDLETEANVAVSECTVCYTAYSRLLNSI